MIIAIDFDGTCVTHNYPMVGSDIGAQKVLLNLIQNGHKLMLWTMRGNASGDNTLQDAVDWFDENDIPLFGINENPEQTLSQWTNSNKQYAQLYIDDAALGCPLKYDPKFHPRPYVDWHAIEKLLISMNLI